MKMELPYEHPRAMTLGELMQRLMLIITLHPESLNLPVGMVDEYESKDLRYVSANFVENEGAVLHGHDAV